MCRIAGIFDPSSQHLQEDILKMRDSMYRGGPDDAGLYLEGFLALGHRRLSIIDLSTDGHQPMLSENNNLVICYNGEIYNFQEIKVELERDGYIFKTKTDTEVIIKSFEKWGVGCLERFNGMFALAIFNKEKQELILARDYAGIKPLYYSFENGKFYFASEIRALKTLNIFKENADWRIYFLAFGHLPEPITTLNNVQPLPKGTYLKIDLSNKLSAVVSSPITYHQFIFTNTITSREEALKLVRKSVQEAVKRHLISDAPIGLFLSGGIDSSLLTILAEPHLKDKLKTLSIYFEDEKYSEKKFQDIIVKQTGSNHQSFKVKKEAFNLNLPNALEAMDQPSTDGINSYFICKYAKEAGLTAVHSGLGADELFGGYNSFKNAKRIALLQSFIPSWLFNLTQYLTKDKFIKISYLSFKNPVGDYLFHRGLHGTKEIAFLLNITESKVRNTLITLNEYGDFKKLKNKEYNQLPCFNYASYLEINGYMQNQLLKDSDYMSMWHGIEIRVPFLDKKVMETAFRISPKVKIGNGDKKFLILESFREIPKSISKRAKQGFTFPFENWMKSDIQNPVTNKTDDLLEKSFRHKNEYVDSQFKKGNYSWSRYWAYQLIHNQ